MVILFLLLLAGCADGGISIQGSTVEVCPYGSFFGVQEIDLQNVNIVKLDEEERNTIQRNFVEWNPKANNVEDIVLDQNIIEKYSNQIVLGLVADASDAFRAKEESHFGGYIKYISLQFPNGYIVVEKEDACGYVGWMTNFWGDGISKGDLSSWVFGHTCGFDTSFFNASFSLDPNPYRELFDLPGIQLLSRYLVGALFFIVSTLSLSILFKRYRMPQKSSPLIIAVLAINGFHGFILGILFILDGDHLTGVFPHRYSLFVVPSFFCTSVGTDYMLNGLWRQLRMMTNSMCYLWGGLLLVLLDVLILLGLVFAPNFRAFSYQAGGFAMLLQFWIIVYITTSTAAFLSQIRSQILVVNFEMEQKLNGLLNRVAKSLPITMVTESIRFAFFAMFSFSIIFRGPGWDRFIVTGFALSKICSLYAQTIVCQIPSSNSRSSRTAIMRVVSKPSCVKPAEKIENHNNEVN